jgi:SAM-dependent methyltransferase
MSNGTSDNMSEEQPLWHRKAVGGLWDEIGRLQFDYLVSQGLEPHHRLLDVGCGSLRGGVHFIAYLDPDRYSGVDQSAELIDAGLHGELSTPVRELKRPQFMVIEDFAFTALGRRFDYALAQSVFTHLPPTAIARCLESLSQVLMPDGRFYATFFEASDDGQERVEIPSWHEAYGRYYDQRLYYYSRERIRAAAQSAGLGMIYIGEWGHPRGQKMLGFIKVPPSTTP